MSGTFYTYEDRSGYYRWYLKDTNGRKIADSGEGYASRYNCERAVRNVISTCRGNVQVVNG
ncbi:MAG: YegP family protein [Actinomycetota bacterium]